MEKLIISKYIPLIISPFIIIITITVTPSIRYWHPYYCYYCSHCLYRTHLIVLIQDISIHTAITVNIPILVIIIHFLLIAIAFI